MEAILTLPLLGRYFTIPPSRYLLNQLRRLLTRGKKWGPQRLQLWHHQDLQLWMKFLQNVTNKGVPINNTVFVKPSVPLWSDACEYRIGGYSENGLAWIWRIPASWHGKLTLNLLEFLASAVTIYMTIYMTILKLGQGSHILALTDSSSALDWMHKSSFDPVNAESQYELAIWLGWTLVSHETYLYSQHIRGTEKIIADSLLRDFHRSE